MVIRVSQTMALKMMIVMTDDDEEDDDDNEYTARANKMIQRERGK